MSAPSPQSRLLAGPERRPPSTRAAEVAARLDDDRAIQEVRSALASLRFGSVTLIVQDGRVVQVETVSKVWLAARGGAP
ncbi:MAG: YezD family protein [Chloroflexi bacterium]|nr:YezD family protein [Chloroflexota bacterium]